MPPEPSLPPFVAWMDFVNRGYATYPPGFYVGMGFLLGLLIGYAWFRFDAAAWWRAYRRVRRAEQRAEEKEGKKEE